jgi:ABC-2 type transport system permease protein
MNAPHETAPRASAHSTLPRGPRTTLTRLTAVEARLFLRDRVPAVLILALPAALVIAFGLIPGFDEPSKDLSGQTGNELIGAIAVALVLALLGLSVLPTVLATYREQGVLRRMSATPVSPVNVLGAQLVVYVGAAVLSMVLLLGIGKLAFGVPLPANFPGFLLAAVLGMAALFAVGLLIAALARGTKAANAISLTLFFPSMFLAGVYVPREALPPLLRHISDFTPLGAALQSVRDTWTGDAPRLVHLVTMAGYAVLASVAAARTFRWE